MNARSAARELSLILFSQLSKDLDRYKKADFSEFLLKSVRILVNNAQEDLKLASSALVETREFLDKYETEHPTNIERPLGTSNLPVAIPLTSDMAGRLDQLINVADKSFAALEIAEMTALQEKTDVKEYIIKIMEAYKDNKDDVKKMIKKYSKGWDFDRLVKIDRDILKIAIAELVYIKEAPISVAIDEAVELAKKYSMDESSRFINGILGQITKDKELIKED